jgi:acyl-CoA thioesterase FadM
VNATAALPAYRATIEPAYIDYNGHLRDAYYGLIFSYAIDDVMDHLGLGPAYRERTGCTLYTLEMHLHYLHEVKASDELTVETSILDADRKRFHAGSVFRCTRLPEPVAIADAMLLHVHQGEKVTTAPFPAEIEARLQALKLTPEALAAFGPISRRIELRRR